MSVIMYGSQAEESLSVPVPITICPKCGRLFKINDQCECEELFFGRQSKKKENSYASERFIKL
jgi:hypothetical protein